MNKLAEVMNRKEFSQKDKGKKISQTEFKKKEKECRKLQQELTQVRTTVHLLLTAYHSYHTV